ncbi:gluconate 2-dehydrogenase subunit 3 family protein [Arthrospiribacter ruber]|uniref:Gluconate 2-dehydrogenase subunit 3 family protein n=1 Tax=Arthrospiribacter ruber TaxID=2487934 RepID=A0A951MEL5_9BACT|nr:gluconate 2-dehydrogenase subunit 3 family protein [Arthrospiribacter ruber]MBW3468505.1 gluconate 2-dehydrogenase subunit 3 family protein [Arthrospiribacter ruber]
MDRRTALKSLAITVWGMIFLPGCGNEEAEQGSYLYKNLPLSENQKNNLKSMVDTFLPENDTKGGVELGIHHFLDKLLANCYDESTQNAFLGGLDRLEFLSNEMNDTSFFKAADQQRIEVLEALDKEEKIEDKAFYDLIKELIILGYTSSEYFLTNFTNYEMIPGGYDGCAPLPQEPYKI